MAKLKSKINSKYKATPKRKLVLGGPEESPYLGKTLYEAQTAPNAMFEAQSNVLQTQFEKDKAARDEQLKRNLLDRQMLEMQMANSATEQRQQEEQTQRDITADTNTQQVQRSANRAVGTGLKTGFQAARNAYQLQQSTNAAMAAAKPSIQYGWEMGSTIPAGPNSPIVQSATKAGLQAGAKAVGSAALVAAPEIAGKIASNQLNKADDRQIKKQGKSQYFDDTEYSSKEYNAQLLESTGRGATIGGTIASAIPIPGVATGAGMAIGAAVGLGAGLIKAQHQRRMTKSENERGFKIGDKRFGKKLLFGEENVYDENLDPTVLEKRNREAQLQAMTNTANAMENARMASMMQSDLNTGNRIGMAKYGGAVKKFKGGVAVPIGNGALEYLGETHATGGIKLPGNIEVEDRETEHPTKEGGYIFSATLKLPNGKTYAQAHKALIKSGATGEEIEQLALSQEMAAGRNPNQIKGMKFAKYGGPLQYDKGGKKENGEENSSLSFDEKTRMRIHSNEGAGPGGLTTAYLDTKGYWTIGHGHLLTKPDGTPYTSKDTLPKNLQVVTMRQVEDWANADYNTSKSVAENWVGKETWNKLPDATKSGIIELIYGVGSEKVKKFKGVKEALISGNYEKAGEEIVDSKYYTDIKSRRGNQIAALVGGDEEVLNNSAISGQYVVPKEKAIPYLKRGQQINLNSTTATTATTVTQPVVATTPPVAPVTKTGTPPAEITANPGMFFHYDSNTDANDAYPKGFKFNPQSVVTAPTQTPIGVTPPVNTTVEETPKTPTGKFRDINMNPIPLEEEEIPTFITDAKTGERIELNPKRDNNFNPDIVPDSKYSSGSNIGGGSTNEDQTMKKDTKKDTQPVPEDNYRKLAYAAQFAQPAYALLNPYKSKYSETPVSISAPMAGMMPTVGTNINLSREDFSPIIAGINAQVAAGTENARNIAGPGGIAAEIALRGKGMQAMLDTKAKEADANRKLSDAEKQLQLTASLKNQAVAQNAAQLQTQVAAQQAQLEAARGARMATAKETANLERYTNTGQAIGYAGAGIGTMYKDQNQLDTQYKIALATDPTGSAARWLQSNDPAAYERYIKSMQKEPVETTEEKKFGGLKNSYVSRLGQLSKRPLKAKI